MAFLTETELSTLTRRKQPAARIRVLKKQGIAFKLDGDGRPVVSWASVNAVSGRVPKRATPNHEALQQLMEPRNGKAPPTRQRTPT
jgi:hypothetical protein